MTQTLLTAEEADEILSPHRDTIRSCIVTGWGRWQALLAQDPELAPALSARTRASAVYDFVAYRAREAFAGTPGVVVSDERGFLILNFRDKILLRFKKFRDRSLRTASVPTAQSNAFAQQSLPGMEMTHLVAGYLPDAVAIGLDQIAITCTLEGEQLWVLDLELVETSAVPVQLPQRAGEQPDTVVRPRPAAGQSNDEAVAEGG